LTMTLVKASFVRRASDFYLFSQEYPLPTLRRLIQSDLRGELTSG